MAAIATVLLIDDELETLKVLEMALESTGYEVLKTNRGKKALGIVAEEPVDLVFLDYRMPEMDGLEVLKSLQADYPDLPVIMLTAEESIQLAVKAIKAGAFDYLNKPFNYHQIQIVAEKALEQRRLRQENTRLRGELETTYQFDNLIGRSEVMQAVFRRITKAAESDASVLIQGENGTGKELIARAIHYNSPRRKKPFVAVDCAAIPEPLMESELFGHEKGAFTGASQLRKGKFELAHGGTLFLDEIAEMNIDGQAKLLRALQEHQFSRLGGEKQTHVDIRVIAATNQPLDERIRTGSFRQDLYYRLNVIPIFVPPLRERLNDIPMLVNFFIQKLSGESKAPKVPGETLKQLMESDWPGNIRQLENTIHSALALCEGESIQPEDLGPDFKSKPSNQSLPQSASSNDPPNEKNLSEQVRDYERSLVRNALNQADGIEKQAASILGISERSMWHLVKKHGLKKKGSG